MTTAEEREAWVEKHTQTLMEEVRDMDYREARGQALQKVDFVVGEEDKDIDALIDDEIDRRNHEAICKDMEETGW